MGYHPVARPQHGFIGRRPEVAPTRTHRPRMARSVLRPLDTNRHTGTYSNSKIACDPARTRFEGFEDGAYPHLCGHRPLERPAEGSASTPVDRQHPF